MGRFLSSLALACWLQLGLTIPLYTKILVCLCQLFCLVVQTRKSYRGLWQGLQQKIGLRTSLSTGLHLQLCCLDVDYLGSWHGSQLGRRYTTWVTEICPSGTSIRFAFPLTCDPVYGWTESPNLLCYKLFMKSLTIPF